MLITLIRALILYVLVIFAVRLMGKRQIGELAPTELVITILISEIAAIPMQDNEIPMAHSVAALLLLVTLEIFSSVLGMKNKGFRKLTQGSPVAVINNGKADMKMLRRLRFTVEDLETALRQQGVFDISEVHFAVVETNGSISVLLNKDVNK